MLRDKHKAPGVQRGIALIVVLWVCALMSVLAAGFAYALRSEAQLNAAVLERARAAAGAEAGVQRILVMLKSAQAGGPRSAPLQHYELHYDGMELTVELVSEAGKIDLNAAPEVLIEGLLQRAAIAVDSLDQSQAQTLAEVILDWRDADSRVRDHGAERRDYQALGLAGPRDQPFISVSELRQVLGMSRQTYAFLSPLVSVNSQSSRIDPRAAARDTLLAVPGLDEAQVDSYLAGRAQGAGGSDRLALMVSSAGLLVPTNTRAYSITAEARAGGGVRALRRAVIRLNRSATAPIAILGWSNFRQGNAVAAGAEGDV